MISTEQAEIIIQLLREIRDTGAASAIVLNQILEEQCRPRRAIEKLNAMGADSVAQNDRMRREVEAKHEAERRLTPTVWVSGAGIARGEVRLGRGSEHDPAPE